jgi:hypothetical protein
MGKKLGFLKKPGFLQKSVALARKFGKKPGFFGINA